MPYDVIQRMKGAKEDHINVAYAGNNVCSVILRRKNGCNLVMDLPLSESDG